MTNRKQFRLRATSWMLLIVMVFQVFMPTVAWAQLTSLNTQPEVWSYQPVDATDNVNLSNGAFNYTVPITSLPEFPMAVGYSSGVKMNQEAGMFGLGVNGSAGAIARNVMGIPDDVNGGPLSYSFSNQRMIDAAVSGTFSVDIMGDIMGETSSALGSAAKDYVSLSPSVTLKMGYNNYTGVYGSIGIGLSAGFRAPIAKNVSGSLGAFGDLVSDSRSNGLIYGAGADIGIHYGNDRNSVSLSGNTYVGGVDGSKKMNRSSSVGLNANVSVRKMKMALAGSLFESGNNSFSQNSVSSVTSLPQLASVVPYNRGWGASISYPVTPSVTLTADFSTYNYGDETYSYSAYGFSHLKNYDRANPKRNQIADYTLEGESSFDANRNNPSYLQRDLYNVNTMGMSGAMQYFQGDYGVVSRNYARTQYRSIGLVTKTTRSEVYPWYKVTSTHSNKDVDILALLGKKSNPEDSDFDNVFFGETEVNNFNGSDRKFGDATLRMKGDMGGEFDFSASGPFNHDVNQYRMDLVPSTGDHTTTKLFKIEKDIPLYSPGFAGTTGKDYAAAEATKSRLQKDKGTNIKKVTLGDMVSGYTSYLAANNNDASIFNNSFYNHQKIKQKTTSTGVTINGPNHANDFQDENILKHLNDLVAANPGYLKDVVGSIEVNGTNGMRYLFGLPAFNKGSKTVGLKGKGITPPVKDPNGTDFHSFGTTDRAKTTTQESFMYPYAWMLTAIVGDDYVDFDGVPGPSEGDLGFWVKFKYVRTADDYQWRTPYMGLTHFAGAYHTYDDDYYSVQAGTKEIYYLSEIESANHLVKYVLDQRLDGLDAPAGLVNGDAFNAFNNLAPGVQAANQGSNFQFAVSQIDLYKKHDGTEDSQYTMVSSTLFKYDYSLCQGIPNNYMATHSTTPTFVSNYYYSATDNTALKGKLTLRKIQTRNYDAQGNHLDMPAYRFNYGNTLSGPDNPPYDDQAIDQWGNYVADSKVTLNSKFNTTDQAFKFYSNYTEVDPTRATQNAQAYLLKEVELPAGGKLSVTYKAKAYGYVENNLPYVMRKVRAASLVATGQKTVNVDIDVTDLQDPVNATNRVSLAEVFKNNKLGENPGELAKNRSDLQNSIYGEFAFYKDAIGGDPKGIYVANDKDLQITNFTNTFHDENGRTYQQIEITGRSLPFYGPVAKYMYSESDLMQALKSVGPIGSREFILSQYEKKYVDQENAGPLDAVLQIVSNVTNIFKKNSGFQTSFNNNFGSPGSQFIPGLSFVRTPIYKGKYSGAAVDKIEMTDGFSSLLASGTKTENHYKTQYFYDQKADGSGLSSGVATIEPGGGMSSVIDVLQLSGAGFAPGPSITNAKTTVSGAYSPGISDNNLPRKKGKTVYEFYTSKLPQLQFASNFKQKEMPSLPSNLNYEVYQYGAWGFIKVRIFHHTFKIHFPLPVFINYRQSHDYAMKSYAYKDNTDLIGKPMSTKILDQAGNPVNSTTMNYFQDDDPITMYKDNTGQAAYAKRPGKIDQVWSESFYSKESSNMFALLYLQGRSNEKFAYTNMKYSYLPPVLKSIEEKQDVITKSTENVAFDFYTGNPVLVKTKDSYGNVKFTRSEPAYWYYPEMGASSDVETNVNKLTEIASNTVYLNTATNDKVLGASFNSWAKPNTGAYNFAEFLQPEKVASGSGFQFKYTKKTGDQVASAFGTKQAGAFKITNTGNLYLPAKTYAYRIDLNTNGTGVFAGTFIPFVANSSAALPQQWQVISENTLYAHNAQVLESKDILGKYTASHLGYNMSHSVSQVANGSYYASVFEGGEYIYADKSSGASMLNDDRVKLESAILAKGGCVPSYDAKVLNTAAFPGTTTKSVVYITLAQNNPVNTTLFSLKANFANGTSRVLNFYQDPSLTLRAITSQGESFDGFYVLQRSNPTREVILNPADFSSVTLLSSLPASTVTLANNTLNKSYIDCYNNRKYNIPKTTCTPAPHTGDALFYLNAGTSGTSYTFPTDKINSVELARRYKASVWVHQSSAAETQLVVSYTTSAGVMQEKSVSLTNAYAEAGEWKLLRLDFALADFSGTAATSSPLKVFVRNNSSGGYSYYDDLRVLPYQAMMQSATYDVIFDRPTSSHDGEGFASWYTYDTYGRSIEKSIEVQSLGKKVSQRKAYNFQRSTN